MEKKGKSVGAIIIGSAIIWAAVIIGCSFALKGTGCYDKIQYILFAGVFTHLILIWGPVAILYNKIKNKN